MATEPFIEPLGAGHQRGEFACGRTPLDVFLHQQAGQYERKGVGRTFVLVHPGSPRVIGYYTLAASSVPFENLPADVAKKHPRHPMPVILIGRLATDLSVRGKGLGAYLLLDACRRVARLAKEVGVFAAQVHALDEGARTFYERYGFRPFSDQPRHLFLPVETILAEFAG